MIIGVPKEIKDHEYRVGLTPGSVRQLVQDGNKVLMERSAGKGIGADDNAYADIGATILESAADVYSEAEMIVKVKEPLMPEIKMMQPGQILFGYLHLASNTEMTAELVASGASCIACETVTDRHGHLPLLAPMSKVAGRLAAQAVAFYLQSTYGGRGKLIGGVPGVAPAKLVIVGGGTVGRHAARIAHGMGADVTVFDKDAAVMDDILEEFNGGVKTVYSSPAALEEHVVQADALIGCVLIPGAAAPKVVSEAMIKSMRPGSVVVDVAIDQGGCIETSRPTTHTDPIYIKHNVVHYCVTNIPGVVPHTSTYALNNVTLRFVSDIASKGLERALADDPHFRAGLSIANGELLAQV